MLFFFLTALHEALKHGDWIDVESTVEQVEYGDDRTGKKDNFSIQWLFINLLIFREPFFDIFSIFRI